jgi:hypothetical protein
MLLSLLKHFISSCMSIILIAILDATSWVKSKSCTFPCILFIHVFS